MQIKKLVLKNFKGHRDLVVDFNEHVTSICGQNATGKTTVFDAFLWLLFGKDSAGRSDFGIRYVDSNGNIEHNTDIVVIGYCSHNGEDYVFQKTQRENWVKKRGYDEPEFKGNQNIYEVDGYPKSEKEYKEIVQKIMDETSFKLLTSPTAFTSLKWQEQRKILMGFVEEMPDADLAEKLGGYDSILPDLRKESPDNILKKLKADRVKLNNVQNELPVRIDELSKQIADIDEAETEAQIARIKTDIELAEAELERTKLPDIGTINQKIMLLEKERQQLVTDANNERMSALTELQTKMADLQISHREAKSRAEIHQRDAESYTDKLTKQEALFKELGDKFTKLKTMTFDERQNVCKYCGQTLPADRREQNKKKFEDTKKRDMDVIQGEGRKVKKNIMDCKTAIKREQEAAKAVLEEVDEIAKSIVALDEKMKPLRATVDITGSPQYGKLTKQIMECQKDIENLDVLSAERVQKTADVRILRNNLSELESRMATVSRNEEIRKRIDELTIEQRENNQMIAEVEQRLNLVEKFIRAKLDSVSDSINKMFNGLTFKLFDFQINGGMKECCEVTYNGVPYSDLNTGHRVVAGLEIIRALQRKFDTYAPVFIDNAESINEFNVPDMGECQMILLKVTEDKELTVC